MTEQPSFVAREAKSIHQSLKELLKSKEPFDKEVDFQRKNLRRRYLNLLLVHPTAKESKDVENHLWMQTSYAFISSYKQRIAALDRAIQNNQRQQQQQQHQQPLQRQNNHGPVEYRKLTQRFRQFLADEDKFWTQLVLRLFRLFDLHEAQPALYVIGLLGGTDDVVAPAAPAADGPNVETRDGATHGSNGRNHFQFPPEDPATSFAPTTPEERASRMAILTKAVICLGDIARYRELYNESGGRPRAGHEDGGPARRGRNRRGGVVAENFPRQRNYEKAQLCYEQARLLLPYEGNPSHQLAILASYKKDSFASLVHYYRALCVRQPYDTAAENLGTVLTKALELWRQRTRRGEKHVDTPLAPRVRVEAFKEKVVVLHALWRVGMDKGIEKMNSISPKHSDKVANDFYALVSERHLPIDMISNSIVLSQGALWKHRMIRDNAATHHARDDSSPIPAGTSTIVEWGMLDHLLDLHYALLEVGKDELKDPPPMDGVDDLAQRISATFRRTLPALRIASKWLRANFKYVIQDQEFAYFQQTEKGGSSEKKKKTSNKISAHSTKTLRFWKTYAQFSLALSLAFPANKLPSLSAPLEEDIEMRGFSPLRNLMDEAKISSEKLSDGVGQIREQVHPNVEQLMRIADLLDDAKALVATGDSPLLFINNHIVFNPDAVEVSTALFANEVLDQDVDDPVIPIRQQQLLATIRDTSLDLLSKDPDDDNMTERTSRTDDDVVRDAFKFLNTEEDVEDMEMEEDEIVWDPRANISPVFSPSVLATPITPVKPMLSPKIMSPRSFNAPALAPAVPTTTAQDLLNEVINFGGGGGSGRTMSGNAISESTAPQPPFLFGSELSNRPSQSIWSTSRDEQPLRYAGNGNASGQIYQTSPRQFTQTVGSPSQDLSQQSIWSSSYPNQSQNSQQYMIGALPSPSFAQPPHSTVIGGGGHHRLPSASAVAAQLFPTQKLTQNDPFAYASPTLQHRQPVLGAEPHLSPTFSGYLNSSLVTGGGFGGSGDVTATSAAAQYYTSSGSASYHHSRQVSMHDARQNHLSPPMSQMWSSMG